MLTLPLPQKMDPLPLCSFTVCNTTRWATMQGWEGDEDDEPEGKDLGVEAEEIENALEVSSVWTQEGAG